MPEDLMRYDQLAQHALRGVVREALRLVERGGLPGEHHFYITFKTQAPGVDIPQRLIERFPDEMTIVLQNRYWDLLVDDRKFSVGLSFNQVPSKLVIPYSAITGFHDPRQHAVSLGFVVPCKGECVPSQGALEFTWLTPEECLHADVRAEMTGGQDKLVMTALAHVGVLP